MRQANATNKKGAPNRTTRRSPAKGCREQYRPTLPYGSAASTASLHSRASRLRFAVFGEAAFNALEFPSILKRPSRGLVHRRIRLRVIVIQSPGPRSGAVNNYQFTKGNRHSKLPPENHLVGSPAGCSVWLRPLHRPRNRHVSRRRQAASPRSPLGAWQAQRQLYWWRPAWSRNGNDPGGP